jgi:TetR/AcrR family transcriptional regulator
LVQFKFDYFVENPVMIWLLNGENMLCAQYLKRSTRLKDMHISLVRAIGTILDSGVAAGTIGRDVDPLQLYMSSSDLSYFFFSNGGHCRLRSERSFVRQQRERRSAHMSSM